MVEVSTRLTGLAGGRAPWSTAALRWSGIGLVAASWISAALFGLYILAFYGGAIPGHLDQWNRTLPRLYDVRNPQAALAMGAHFITGGVILLLGPVQLVGALRRRWPRLHRWLGRLYVAAAGVAGVGGLGYILTEGTIGGLPMDLGFGLYGALMTLAAVQTYRHARAGRFDVHRAWAIRLFALAIGSWLYRMDYGFWLAITGGLGHRHDFHGAFDVVMAFMFYLPNLAVAELFIRARGAPLQSSVRPAAILVLNLATLVVALGAYKITALYWGPGIVNRLLGHMG